ncbi:MAG: HEAT repeat domain-containing protein [Phycisphaeraceae bacterium]|nr:HEAT repeat domain-containing protein [Phycisphaeraceae bacterium]
MAELFNQGCTDVKALNILKPMAASEHVQAVMLSTLEYNRALKSNASHCALSVLAKSRNRDHVPSIIRLLQEGLESHEDPTMEAMALGQLGGHEAYTTLCETIVRDISPTFRWIIAEQLVKFGNAGAIPYLEAACEALDVTESDRGAKRRITNSIYTLAGGATHSLSEFTMPVYDRNIPNFSQYIGGNLSRFDTDYVNLKPYGLEVGVSPEALFEQHKQCAFYMKAGHEFVCIRGTMIAPITLPDGDSTQNRRWTDRLGLVYPRQILNQIKAYQDKHVDQSSILLEEGSVYGIVTPEKSLLAMRVSHFGQYETGAEATTLTFLKLATEVERQGLSREQGLSIRKSDSGTLRRPAQPPQAPDAMLDSHQGLNIYLLEDETLTWDDCKDTRLDALVLRRDPWIQSSDILRYDTSTHCMTLQQERPVPLERVSMKGNPFVVTVGYERCYLGAVWTPLSSYLPTGVTPRINIPDVSHPPNVVGIELLRVESRGAYVSGLDVRSDFRVLEALKAQKVSHAGLSMDLEPITVMSVRDTVTVPAEESAKSKAPSVWVTLLLRSPIASLEDYWYTHETTPSPKPPLYKPVPIPACTFEMRRADTLQRVARVPYAASFRSNQLTRKAQRMIGDLGEGDYWVALCIGDQRCSNVAHVTLGPVKDPGSLSLVPLPLAPEQSLPVIGIRAVGPDPQDQDVTNMDMAFPMLLVDGIERQPREHVWMGPVGPLQSGRVYTRLLDLNRFMPAIEPGKQHTVKAIVKRYESEPVVIPADDTLGRAWDAATASLGTLTPPMPVLKGSITGLDGKPGAGHEVCLSQMNGTRFTELANPEGQYAMVNIPSGS